MPSVRGRGVSASYYYSLTRERNEIQHLFSLLLSFLYIIGLGEDSIHSLDPGFGNFFQSRSRLVGYLLTQLGLPVEEADHSICSHIMISLVSIIGSAGCGPKTFSCFLLYSLFFITKVSCIFFILPPSFSHAQHWNTIRL